MPHRTPARRTVHPRTARGRLATVVLTATAAVALVACGGGTETASGAGGPATTAPADAVTVYTGRHYGIEEVFAAFTAQTGIPVAFQTGKDPELRERLAAEGATTRADLLMTADAGNLDLAADAGLLQRTDSAAVAGAVPANLRDADGRWTALSRRARTVVYSPERVTADQVPAGYEALADPRWKGKLCLRPATSPYTQSLVASMIANQGEARAEEVVRGWMANEPTFIDSDTKILEAIDAGQCDVGITNTYYLARLLETDPDAGVRIAWPPLVHVNVSGAGAVPANLRDADGRWTALSRRARTVVYSPERVTADQVPAGYEALADPRWKGKLCLRPATSPYTQSLVASMIANQGEARAEEVVRGWMANEPTFIDSDTKILEAIDAGQCDVGITNTYYLARLLETDPDAGVRIAWPPLVHVNVSGAGVTTHAPNPDKARVLLEWLAGPGQKAFADANHEYPAATGVEPTAVLVGFGPLTADPIEVARFGDLQPAAVDLLERTGHA